MNKIKLQFKGLLSSPASWARVNRELIARLANNGNIDPAIQPCRGFLWSADFSLPENLKKLFKKHPLPDCRLMFAYPPALKKYDPGDEIPLWNLSVYEASRLPSGWAEALNRYCSRVVIPSTHVRRVYMDSAVDKNKLLVIPYGYNKQLIEKYRNDNPYSSHNQQINIITVATPHRRKGLDLIEKCSELLKNSHLNWHIHSPYQPEKENARFWETAGILKKLERAGFQVTRETVDDEKIIQFLSRADLCVQPSRSEGFGLVILEAMAAGTPVITSNWGGHLDFAGPGMITIDGELREAKYCQYDSRHPDARVFEPDQKQLLNTILRLTANRRKLQKMGTSARQTVKKLTWKNSARQLAGALKQQFG